MDEHRVARAFGWLSVGFGVVVVAIPAPLMKASAWAIVPTLYDCSACRTLCSARLLRGRNKAAWCRARGVADALDAVLIGGGAAAGAFPRDRAPIGVAWGACFSTLSFWLARRLDG